MPTLYIDHGHNCGLNGIRVDNQLGLDESSTDQHQQLHPQHREHTGHDAAHVVPSLNTPRDIRHRPDVHHASTHPASTAAVRATSSPTPQSISISRNRSPYSRSHLRSRSSGSSLCAPAMTRSHSWAGNSARTPEPVVSAASPSPSHSLRSTVRARSPLSHQEDTLVYSTPQKMWYDIQGGVAIESIQEDSELDLTPRGQGSLALPSSSTSRSSSLRRRPASPLRSVTNASSLANIYSSDQNLSFGGSNSHSPALGPQRFNEAYPALHHYASSSSFSSISSTPTSQRSRSPSISSLETIEDVPDLESEAIEVERIEQLKLAAEREERAENGEDVDDRPQRRSLDGPRGFGFSRGGNRERKRWSVCGGERRADLDLETIWED